MELDLKVIGWKFLCGSVWGAEGTGWESCRLVPGASSAVWLIHLPATHWTSAMYQVLFQSLASGWKKQTRWGPSTGGTYILRKVLQVRFPRRRLGDEHWWVGSWLKTAHRLDSHGGREWRETKQKKLGCNVGDPMASSEARMVLQNEPPGECGGPHH